MSAIVVHNRGFVWAKYADVNRFVEVLNLGWKRLVLCFFLMEN